MTKHIVNNKLVDMNEAEQQAYDERMLDNQNKALPRALDVLRDKRNNLLAETDWMASSDVTMSDDWKTYRTALRDLPSGLDTVEKVNAKEFPTKPGE